MRDGSVVPLDLEATRDSAYDERSIWKSLASVPLTLPASVDSVIVRCETEASNPLDLIGGEVALSFDVLDAERGTPLKKIGGERVFRTTSGGLFERREKIATLGGRRVVVRPALRGFAGGSSKLASTVVHVHTLITDSSARPVTLAAKSSGERELLPSAFALHQNYPNPFNPSTTIKFDLPENSNVSLVVYDVLGRKITELENGMKEAGYHSATWNASDVSSGMYFVRFTASDQNGNVKFSKVSKLLLTK